MGRGDTRQRILAAAAAEFAEKGFAGATTRGIAGRARVNEVTLFRHFGTKRELLGAVLAAAPPAEDLVAGLLAGLAGQPPREALVHLATHWLAFLQPRAGWFRLQLREQAQLPDFGQERGFSLRGSLAEYFRARQAAGDFRGEVDAALAAEAFACGLLGFVVAHELLFPEQDTPPASAYIRAYVDIFLRGMEAG